MAKISGRLIPAGTLKSGNQGSHHDEKLRARADNARKRMTFRPHIAGNPAEAPRPSGTVKHVAEVLDAHQSQVRKLVRSGELESHIIGKRGVRIFLDSVASYQARSIPSSTLTHESPKPIIRRKPANPADIAAHRSAKATLIACGVLGDAPPRPVPRRREKS
jgi:excisionase family DNA binding protein